MDGKTPVRVENRFAEPFERVDMEQMIEAHAGMSADDWSDKYDREIFGGGFMPPRGSVEQTLAYAGYPTLCERQSIGKMSTTE